jgi:dipeptidyl aminopeptidase/acylaminoacyl peptidase
MIKKLRLIAPLGILLGVALLLTYNWATPRLESFTPADGAANAPANQPISLAFSRPMNAASVEQSLTITPTTPGKMTWLENTLTFTPEQPWRAGTQVWVDLQAGARAGGWLPLPLQQGAAWSFTVRQPRLLYLYPSDGPANLYVIDPATGEGQPLTLSDGGVQDFTVSPDGRLIYYSLRNGGSGSQIYRLDPNASGDPAPELVRDCGPALCRALAIAPDGQTLAYERTALPGSGQPDLPQVWLLPLEGAGEPAGAGAAEHITLQPAWSSSGVLAFYDSTDKAYIFYDPKVGELARLPNQTGQPGAWRPGSDEFAVAEINLLDPNISPQLGSLEQLANSHILLYNWRSGQNQDLTGQAALEDTSPAFSPDGRYLAFARKSVDARDWTPGRQAWLRDMHSGQSQAVTHDPLYNYFDFTWDPAGKLLTFVRFNQSLLTEPPEIWRVDLTQGQAAPLGTGGYSPQWLP